MGGGKELFYAVPFKCLIIYRCNNLHLRLHNECRIKYWLYKLLLHLLQQNFSDLTSFRIRVSSRKTFAQFLRNETQNFSFFAPSVLREKQQFAQSFAKSFRAKLPYSAFAKLKFCAILQLEFCAIAQFRKNQKVAS